MSGPHDYQYDYRDGQYYRNGMHPDGAGILPDYDSSGNRTSFHKAGMGWDPHLGASDASRQPKPFTTTSSSSTLGSSQPSTNNYSYQSSQNTDDDHSPTAGAIAIMAFIGLAAIFNYNSPNKSNSYPSPGYTASANPAPTLINPPVEELKSIRNSDARDFYTRFMDYKNTDALFAQFKLQRYSDENPVNPETGITPLSPKNIKDSIRDAFSDTFPSYGDIDKNVFKEYHSFFTVELVSRLAKNNATEDEIAIVLNLVDIQLNQKIADAVDAKFTPFEIPPEPVQAAEETQGEIPANGISADFGTVANEIQDTEINPEPSSETPQADTEAQPQPQPSSALEMGIY